MRVLILLLSLLTGFAAHAQQTFKIDVTGGVQEPLPFAAPVFIAETSAANQVANDMARVVRANLISTGLFSAMTGEGAPFDRAVPGDPADGAYLACLQLRQPARIRGLEGDQC